jgi:RHS repeat-associated protein
MLGGNPAPGSSPATNLLYSGEYFDTDMQQYYLRARWYDQQTGQPAADD